MKEGLFGSLFEGTVYYDREAKAKIVREEGKFKVTVIVALTLKKAVKAEIGRGRKEREGGRARGWEGEKEFYNDKSANLSRTYSSLIECIY